MKSKPLTHAESVHHDALSAGLDAINDRWSLHIVRALLFGASRYTEILRAVGAPRDVLASRLKTLTDLNILRARSTENGGTPGYELTRKGRDLGPILLVLKKWADTYRADDVQVIDFVHDNCGEIFVAEVHCRACGRPVGTGEFSVIDDCAITGAAETEATAPHSSNRTS